MRPVAAPSPGSDPWMVRVTVSRSTGPGRGEVTRCTAIDLDADDPTPGVHPLTYETGRMRRDSTTAPWLVERTRIEALDGSEARATAAAIYDAAAGFLQLGLPPTGATALDAPDRISIEIGDDAWTFPTESAPAQAWLVLRAASPAAPRVAQTSG